MQTEPALGRPSTRRTVGFFQLTQLLGGVLIALSGLAGVLLFKLPLALSEILGIGFISLFVTLPFSLLGVLGWWLGLGWSLGATTLAVRWLRVFILQSAALGLVEGLLFLPAGRQKFTGVIVWFGTCWFVAGLLAAGLAYARWLWPARWASYSARWP